MKVAIIIENADVSLGGAERSAVEIASGLRGLGVDVTMLVAKGQMRTKYFKFLCNDIPGKRVTHKQFAQALEKHFAENHYDIIHSTLPFTFADVYQPMGGSYKETIIRNAASYRSDFLFHWKTLTHWTNKRRSQWLKAEQQLCEPQYKTVIAALSHYVRDQYVKHYNIDNKRIAIILNGVKIHKDVNQEAVDAMRHDILLKLGIKEADEPVFYLFAATNFRLKGLGCAIEALGQLQDRNIKNKAYLLVAGNGKADKYKRLASSLGVADRVLFLGHLKDVQTALRVADVDILPTFYDPASRIIIEGLSAGMPVITTEYNGTSDLFKNNRHGKVVSDPENISELADAMELYLDESQRLAASKAIMDDKLEDNISIERHIGQLLKLYQNIIASKKPGEAKI
ncbi:MAG: glycosyltransferase family 4 protein [Sedimentisphaeraceae bacterium JB056]